MRTVESQLLAEPESDVDIHGLQSVYDSENHVCTLYEVRNAQCWMKGVHDSTSLSALSIPGTHNSPTHHHALPSVRCQAVSPTEQLLHGVRFFDVRVQIRSPGDPNDDHLHLVHGAFPITLTGHKNLRELINDIDSFLSDHPTETIILCLKREGIGKGTDAQLADLLHDHYTDKWYTEPRIPSIGQVRGKIVLMRRFALSNALQTSRGSFGLDAECWPDNTSSATHGSVHVQDFYQVMRPSLIPVKIDHVFAQMQRAAEVVYTLPLTATTSSAQNSSSVEQIHMNFLSASNFGDIRCWPRRIAARLNPAVRKHLCADFPRLVCAERGASPICKGDGCLGIVICDWVGHYGDWDIVDCIVGMNSIRLHAERQKNEKLPN